MSASPAGPCRRSRRLLLHPPGSPGAAASSPSAVWSQNRWGRHPALRGSLGDVRYAAQLVHPDEDTRHSRLFVAWSLTTSLALQKEGTLAVSSVQSTLRAHWDLSCFSKACSFTSGPRSLHPASLPALSHGQAATCSHSPRGHPSLALSAPLEGRHRRGQSFPQEQPGGQQWLTGVTSGFPLDHKARCSCDTLAIPGPSSAHGSSTASAAPAWTLTEHDCFLRVPPPRGSPTDWEKLGVQGRMWGHLGEMVS